MCSSSIRYTVSRLVRLLRVSHLLCPTQWTLKLRLTSQVLTLASGRNWYHLRTSQLQMSLQPGVLPPTTGYQPYNPPGLCGTPVTQISILIYPIRRKLAPSEPPASVPQFADYSLKARVTQSGLPQRKLMCHSSDTKLLRSKS